ncbi:MAG: hypothetical protein WKF61_04545 [Luteimonas sp.]
MKNTKLSVALLLAASGVSIACTQLPMPFVGIIDVSVGDMLGAWFDDYINPARAAMLDNLDERGAAVVGADNWRRNGFVGHITYTTPFGGNNIVYTEKPCNEDAIDGEPKTEESGGEGGSGDHSGGTYDGGNWDYVNAWFMSHPLDFGERGIVTVGGTYWLSR